MSVECARELRRRSDTDDSGWQIRQGSILDDAFVSSLGTFDIVYAWGVLHHTGALDTAMGNAAALVDDGGHLYISIYNYQALQTEIWTWVKRKYNTAGPIGRAFALTVAAAYLFGRGALARGWHAARRADRDPETRGMNLWRDAVDWAGGWPFEARRPEDVFQFFHDRGFELERLRTHMGSAGCNEFVFRRSHS
jgi:2-polyprenyl-6-hydroxyphenyl methylase/3-demethylubiquinone-9 3-methyltransferase